MGSAKPHAAQLLLCCTLAASHLAASHPFGAAQMLTVGLGDGGAAGDREYPAEVLNTDADNDLAVLRIVAPPSDLPALECVSSRPHPRAMPECARSLLVSPRGLAYQCDAKPCPSAEPSLVCDPHRSGHKPRHAAQPKKRASHAKAGPGKVCMCFGQRCQQVCLQSGQ